MTKANTHKIKVEQRDKVVNSSKHFSVVSDLWASCSKPNPQARLRLFCFPYAGAGSSLFNAWLNLLLPEIELYLIHLPGRDRRIREAPYQDLPSLVESLTDALYPYLDKPFAFFGHSMGALLGFEVVRQLRRQYAIQPIHLFLSGRQPPHVQDIHPNIHLLPEEEFLKTTEELYGTLPEIILQDQELLRLFLSIMRADITMIETYQYMPEDPLNCPVSVFGGLQDPSVNQHGLAAWREQTLAAFNLKMLPGDHFFIQSARTVLVQTLNNELSKLLQNQNQKGEQRNG